MPSHTGPGPATVAAGSRLRRVVAVACSGLGVLLGGLVLGVPGVARAQSSPVDLVAVGAAGGIVAAGVLAPPESPESLTITVRIDAPTWPDGRPPSVNVRYGVQRLAVDLVGNGTSVVDTQVLGAADLTYDELWINGEAPRRPTQITVPLTNPTFRAWAQRNIGLNGTWQVFVVANADRAIDEGGRDALANNEAAGSINRRSRPLTSTLRFGVAQAALNRQAVNLITSDPGCPGAGPRLPGANAAQLISSGSGHFPPIVLDQDLCVTFAATADGFDLVAAADTAFDYTLTGDLGGIPIALAVRLTNQGIEPRKGTLEIPGVSNHADLNGLPNPLGRPGITVGGDGTAVGDLDEARLTGGNNARWIQVGQLPFSLRVDALMAGVDQVVGTYDLVWFHHRQRYHAADPRRLRENLATNDTWYFTAQPAGQQTDAGLLFTATGVTGQVDFAGGSGTMHLPKALVVAPPHTARFVDNALTAAALDAPLTLVMTQGARCDGCANFTPRPLNVVATVDQPTLSADGALLGAAHYNEQVFNGPGFGPLANDNGDQKRVFARPEDAARGAVAMFPGHLAGGTRFDGDADVTRYLRAPRRAEVAAVGIPAAGSTGYPGSRDFAVGNGFFPGLTAGPEVLADGQGQPQETSVGTTLANLPTRVGLGPAEAATFFAVNASAGTKYVLRPAGVTGTFHTFDAPELTIYGYPLRFQRFAFRTVNNNVDPLSWIDGDVRVGGRADFGLEFDALRLTCTGQLAGGRLRARDCAADPQVNCSQRLRAWRAEHDVTAMAFEPAVGDDACSTGARYLRTRGRLQVQSLGQGLDLSAAWTPAGDAVDAEVLGPARNRVDAAAGDAGFAVMLDAGVTLGPPQGGLDEGFFAFSGLVPVPFFDALHTGLRLENHAPGAAGPPLASLLAAADNLPNNWSTAPLAQVATALADDRNLRAVYRWGSTGFAIDLPLRYDGGRVAAAQGPRFIGLTQVGFDLRVLRVQASVDVLTPDYTQVSFGASADFNLRLAEDVDLSLDLNDPASVARVDNFLMRFLGIGPLLGPAVDAIRNRVSLSRRITGAGFDDFLELGVRAAADATLRVVFDEVSQTLGAVQSLPAQLGRLLVDRVRTEVQALLAPFDQTVGNAVDRIFLQTPQVLVQAELAIDAGLELPAQVRITLEADLTDLERILSGFLHVSGQAARIRQQLAAVRTEAEQLVDRFDTALDAANQAIDRALSLLQPGPLALPVFQCGQLGAPVPGNVLLGQLDVARQRITDTINGFFDNPLGDLAIALAAVGGLNVSVIQQAQADIDREARALAAELDAAVAAMNTELARSCGDFAASTAEIQALLTNTRAELAALRGRIVSLRAQLLAELAGLQNPVDLVTRYATDLHGALDALVGKFRLVLAGEFPDELRGGVNAIRSFLNTRFQFVSPFFVWHIDLPTGSVNFVELFEILVLQQFDAAVGALVVLVEQAMVSLRTTLDFPSADELVDLTVALVMNAPIVEALDNLLHDHVITIIDPLDQLADRFFDQVNAMLRDLLAQLESRVEQALSAANGVLEGIPIDSARMDGYAAVRGGSLERLHVAAEWQTRGAGEEDAARFAGALDIVAWSANGKGEGCGISETDARSLLDAKITGYDVPFSIGGSDAHLSQVFLGFTLDDLVPIGLFGGLDTVGDLDFQGFKLFDLGLRFGAGLLETYLGAKGSAAFSSIQMEAAFLVGRTCSDEVLLDLDPQVAEFLNLSGAFAGAYVRGGASIPIWDNGCALTVGASADAGLWALAEAAGLRFGGLVGGSLWGEALCIAGLRGSLTALAEYQAGRVRFRGEGFAVAGLGFDCDPHTWTTVPRSRRDSWCGTGDAQFGATYSGGWSVDTPRTSAIH